MMRSSPLQGFGEERRGAERKPLASEDAFKNNVKHKVTLYKVYHAICTLISILVYTQYKG